jgi:hypothetical protein
MMRTVKSVIVIVLLVLFGFRGHVCAQIPVWIDTDAAPNVSFRDKDDLFALLVSFGSPELEIVPSV